MRKPKRLSTAELRAIAKRHVEAALPEDEPDCTPDWVYDTIISCVLGSIGWRQPNAECPPTAEPAHPSAEQRTST